ncbi:hypothetical protein SORBI_3002G012600 [Sorghum bicolor]|uniref:Uncharacterized protein n=1 Tax=Sorghum bicolor TaxID=4558 RepID=C5X7X1_SORBI|nr:hypothetical protein SORBI_3002G012600 [Sorghum bicolor]
MSVKLLEELGLPMGLLPLEDIQEFRYNRDSGFLRLVQAKNIEHTFKKIMPSINEVYVPEASPEKVTFKSSNGLSRTFNASLCFWGMRDHQMRQKIMGTSNPQPV